MDNKIINGNSIEEMNKLPEGSVDLIFADPPYWMRVDGSLKRYEGTAFDGCMDKWDRFETLAEYEAFTRDWLTACYRILKPNGSIWVIGGMQCIYTIGSIMQQIGYWLINDVVWYKKNPTPNFRGSRLNNSHETLIWATKSREAKFTFNYKTAKELNTDTVTEEEYSEGVRKQMGSVWKMATCTGSERLRDKSDNKLHTTQKPEELLYRIIAISSKYGDVVLDPFGGTMTTGAMAKKLGRRYIMIEREKKYCEYGRRRLERIKEENSDIARARLDEKPVRVSVKDMIKNGFLVEGEGFYFKNSREAVAKLDKSGKLLWNDQLPDMHLCVAMAKGVKAKRLNGFDHWYVLRDGKLKSIADVREEYRASL